MKRKITKHLTVGLAFGFIITTACLWAFKAYEGSGIMVMRQFTTWLVASALYGLASLLYDTNIPFPLNAVVHFIVCAGITLAASAVSGLFLLMKWYQWFIYVLPVFVAIYIIIGITVAIATQWQAKIINKKVQKKSEKL